jgi:integrase
MRKGELFGLRKADVDFSVGANGQIMVKRSNDRETTKGNHDEIIPIAAELRPWLEAAIEASPSALVFPRPDGSLYPEKTNLCAILRRALRRAGSVLGYQHKCRAKGCGHVEASANDTIRRCPEDGHKLWVTALVRPITFHQLRHTTGSLLVMSGVPIAAVQKILRHSDVQITADTYTHLEPGYLQDQIDNLRFGLKGPASRPAENAVTGRGAVSATEPTEGSKSFGTHLVPGPAEVRSGSVDVAPGTQSFQGVEGGAGYRVRTDDIQLGN